MNLPSKTIETMISTARTHLGKIEKKRQQQAASKKTAKNLPSNQTKRDQVKRDVRAIQLRRMRPFLNRAFDDSVSKLHESDRRISPYTDTLKGLLDFITTPEDSGFSYESKDKDKANKVYQFYGKRKRLILNGTGRFSGPELKAHMDALQKETGTKWQSLSKCFDQSDALQNLQAILPPHEVTYLLKYDKSDAKKSRSESISISFEAPSNPKESAKIRVTQSSRRTSTTTYELDDTQFAKALAQIGAWVVEAAPESGQAFLSTLENMRQDAQIRERHLTVYGHDRFTQRSQDDLKGRMSDLADRMSYLRQRHNIASTPQVAATKTATATAATTATIQGTTPPRP